MNKPDRNTHLLRILLFATFFSGFASLLYEIIWTRLLVIVFGNTAQSAVIVISIFMAGLSLGSYVVGKLVDRFSKRIMLYGLLEFGIALSALLTMITIPLSRFILSQDIFLSQTPEQNLLIKILLSTIILLPSTFLMGGTLPVLVRIFNTLSDDVSRHTARIYAFNTLGGVVGVLCAGFMFIELFGLYETLSIGIAINAYIGIFTLFFLHRTYKLPEIQKVVKRNNVKSLSFSQGEISLLLAVYSISGLISLAYEVIWTRLITPASGIYIYGFSLMLAVFLLGIAIGSFLYERFLYKVKDIFLSLGMMQIGLAFCSFAIIIFVSFFMPIWTKYLYRLSVPFIVFLIPTIIMGMMFPTVIKVFERSKHIGEHIGTAYALNSFGSIIGAIIAGFILIPLLGSVRSVVFLALINICIGLLLIKKSQPASIKNGVVLSAIILIGLCIWVWQKHDGLFLPRVNKIYIRDALQHNPSARFRMQEDSIASVLAIGGNKDAFKDLYIDGIGTTGLVEETKMIAHLPIMIHPQPKNILVIGFGMGTTFQSALSYPDTVVDVAELVPSVPAMMDFYHADSEKTIHNPRGKIIINDGRNYVFTTKKTYDVVTIDPPPPTNGAGTTVLFSDEFYKDIKKKLAKGGVVQNWIYFDQDPDSIRMITKSFAQNFDYIMVFLSRRNNGIFLVGSDQPIELGKNRIDACLEIPSVREDMNEWGENQLFTYEYLSKRYVGSKKELTKFIGSARAVTDNHPYTEYSLLRNLGKSASPLTGEQLKQDL